MTDHPKKKTGKTASRKAVEAIEVFEFPVEMTEVGPQFVIPGCERPELAADTTGGGKP